MYVFGCDSVRWLFPEPWEEPQLPNYGRKIICPNTTFASLHFAICKLAGVFLILQLYTTVKSHKWGKKLNEQDLAV